MAVGQKRAPATYSFRIIAAWRERVGISQTRFGQMLGISRDHVSKLEQGTREFTLSMQLACERLSIKIAAQTGDLNVLLPNAFDDCVSCGLKAVEIEKEIAK